MTTLTLKNAPQITTKKRRHPRAFKVWDSAVMTQIMQQAADVKAQIEKVSIESETPMLKDLKPFLVPAIILYGITDSYLKLYNTLLKEGLIQSGNVTKNTSYH